MVIGIIAGQLVNSLINEVNMINGLTFELIFTNVNGQSCKCENKET